jgi:hypothetical protein
MQDGANRGSNTVKKKVIARRSKAPKDEQSDDRSADNVGGLSAFVNETIKSRTPISNMTEKDQKHT